MRVGATRVAQDVQLACAAGAHVVVVACMGGGTAAAQEVFMEHAGIPTLPALLQASDALREIVMDGKVQLFISGGIRSGTAVAKALALGAAAVSLGMAALVARGCTSAQLTVDGPEHDQTGDSTRLGAEPGS